MLVGRVRSAATRFAASARTSTKPRITNPAIFVPAAHALSQLLLAQPVSTTACSLQGTGSAGAPTEADGEDEEGSPGSTQTAAGTKGVGPAADSADTDVDVEALTKEVTELRSVRMRLLAEMENTRTIARRDVENAKTYAIQKFAKELLDVADNLERALAATPQEGLEEGSLVAQLHDGVSATERELLKLFEKQGIHKVRRLTSRGPALSIMRPFSFRSLETPGSTLTLTSTPPCFRCRPASTPSRVPSHRC